MSLKKYLATQGVDFRALDKEDRFKRVEVLARELMASIARVIPVLPVSLVSTVFVRSPEKAWSELELKGEVLRLMQELDTRGAHVYIPRGDQDYAITVGLRMLSLRRLIVETEGLYRARPSELPVLTYYANSIEHLFA